MTPDFFSKLIETAPSLGLTLGALWVVSRKLWKSQEEHLDTHKKRVESLEEQSAACNKDREELHKKHSELQANVIDKLTILAEKNHKS